MKRITHTLILFLVTSVLAYGQAFVTTWKTDNDGPSNDNQITIPTTGGGYNYNISWEEVGNEGGNNGSEPAGQTGDYTITFPSSGTYRVSITGAFPRIYFNSTGDRKKILTVEAWGDIAWTSMNGAFYGCSRLQIEASDAPDLSGVTNMDSMFKGCTVLNSNIDHWDVSNVEYMRSMFFGALAFNQPLNNWSVSGVKDMSFMFRAAESFNQDLNNWNTSNVTDMKQMFAYNPSFNGNITTWNTGNVTDMGFMFIGAEVFNQNIGNWNVSKVQNMQSMFNSATEFNQDLNNWDVSTVTQMSGMFSSATSFNGNISNWDVSNVLSMTQMFRLGSSFNQDIINWDVSKVTSMSEMFFGASQFNQNLGDWDVSSVTVMTYMFFGTLFNYDISNWDVSNVTSMYGMFLNASEFDQNLGDWDIGLVGDMAFMFNGSNLSTTNYDNTLIGWAAQTVQPNVTLGATGIEYCLGAAARITLLALPNNWTINDGNENCVVDIPDANFKAVLLANGSINTDGDPNEISYQEAEAYTGMLNITNQSIADLTGIEAFTNLSDLRAGNNLLSDVDLSSNPDLITLILSDNELESLDLSNNALIATLYVQRNDELTGLSVSNLADLNDFDASNTLIDALDLSANSTLTFLSLNSTPITTLDLSSNDDLSSVSLTSTSLESLDLRNGANAGIGTLNLTGNPNLTCISVDDAAFADANFTNIDAGANFSTDCSNVANDITAFSFAEQSSAATIGSGVIDIEVTIGTDLSNLTPTFTISAGATADPATGIAQDFSSAFVYTVTAENPTAVQNWTVNVQEENVAPTDITLDNSGIDENNAVGSTIGNLSSDDANTNDSHSYSLVAGTGDTDNASFSISGDQLQAAEGFDFETKTSYSVRIQTDDGRGGTFEKEFAITINDLDGAAQSIMFDALASSNVGDPNFELTATASSGLAVSYESSNTAVATVNGSTVTIVGAGSTEITASQTGNEDYVSATPVIQTLTVNKANQTITFDALSPVTFGDAGFDLDGSSDSGLTLTYASSDETVATIDGNTVTIIGAGTAEITASQAGNDNYNAATSVTQSLVVNKADQTITLDAIADKDVSDAPFEVVVSATSGLEVNLSVAGPATIAGNTITLDGTEGTVTVTASQAGNTNYNPAADETTSFEVTASGTAQTITFAAIDDQFIEAGSLTLNATASSGLEVTYELVSGPATISGDVVTFTDLGTIVVRATQPGNAEFLPANPVEQSFEVISVTGFDEKMVNFRVYPNPVTDYLMIESNFNKDVQINFINLKGETILSMDHVPNKIDLTNLKHGLYYIRIVTQDQTITHKIIKN